ncbi:hypothetical protein EDB81DRAFT_789873, partial [Dactylonectria macrodidyma]
PRSSGFDSLYRSQSSLFAFLVTWEGFFFCLVLLRGQPALVGAMSIRGVREEKGCRTNGVLARRGREKTCVNVIFYDVKLKNQKIGC